MKPWQFSKPKTPGFGISPDYYLTILCSKAVLPSVLEVVNPTGIDGAVIGFGAPLSANSSDKAVLRQPLERGAYVVATRDRRTVLKLLVVSLDETGFDGETFARSSLAMDYDPDLVARVRGTWHLAQLTFESHHPMVYPALDFFLEIAQRLAERSEGAVADRICERYLLPGQVFHADRMDARIDARDHVSTKLRLRPDGMHAYTLGLQKFNQPEHEILNLFDEDGGLARGFLTAVAQKVLTGDLTRPGDLFGAPGYQFEAREGGFDRALWEGVPVFELLPPSALTASECLRAWAAVAA